MNGHTHLLGGLAAGALLAPAFASGHLIALLAAATLAGPLADIDHPGSMYGKWVPLPGVAKVHYKGTRDPNGGWEWNRSPYWSESAEQPGGTRIEPFRRGPFGNSQKSFGHVGRVLPGGIMWHRGPTHSITMALVFTAIFYFLARHFIPVDALAIGVGVFAGYLSHLALDALNVSGQELLWPYSRKSIRPPWPHIRVGSIGETVTVAALVGVLFLLGHGVLSHLGALVARR